MCINDKHYKIAEAGSQYNGMRLHMDMRLTEPHEEGARTTD
jgi:hypothetical protein